MKRILLGMTALAIFMSSCTKNDKSDTIIVDPPMKAWYITGIIGTSVDATGTAAATNDSIVLTYNTNNTFSSIEETDAGYYGLIKLVYDQLKVSKVTLQASQKADPQTMYELRYAGDNVVRIFAPGKANVEYDSLVYDNNKLVKVVKVKENKHENSLLEYTWTNDNITEEKEYRASPISIELKLNMVKKYTYNNVPNLLKPMATFGLMAGDGPNVLTLSANEVVSRTLAPAGGPVTEVHMWTRSVNENKLTLTDTLRKNSKISYIERFKFTQL